MKTNPLERFEVLQRSRNYVLWYGDLYMTYLDNLDTNEFLSDLSVEAQKTFAMLIWCSENM